MTPALRKIVAAPLWGAVLMAVACGGGGGDDGTPTQPPPPDPDPPGANEVNVGDNFYDPSALAVSAGTTVTWTWTGGTAHSVTFNAGGPSSAVQSNGTFDRNFGTAGQFSYFCTVHGAGVMSGTVTVQ